MTIAHLREIANHHEETAATQYELAKTLLGVAAESTRQCAARHHQWAEHLRQLINAFETFGQLTT